jgi:ABC-type Fe3+-hydroxamate transport system substrate-binding protein
MTSSPGRSGGQDPLPELESEQAPRRVVSLVPYVTESLIELGCGAALAGVTEQCLYPSGATERYPRIGSAARPDLDHVLEVHPDLVIVSRDANRPEDIARLAGAGLRVWAVSPDTVWGAINMLWTLTRIFRAGAAGQSLSLLETSCEWTALAAENSARLRVFCALRSVEPGPGRPRLWMTCNKTAYTHDLLCLCGGENVFAERAMQQGAGHGGGSEDTDDVRLDDPRYPFVTAEDIARVAPELVLLASGEPSSGEEDVAVLDSATGARVAQVQESLLTWAGIRVARALADLPALLQPAPSA